MDTCAHTFGICFIRACEKGWLCRSVWDSVSQQYVSLLWPAACPRCAQLCDLPTGGHASLMIHDSSWMCFSTLCTAVLSLVLSLSFFWDYAYAISALLVSMQWGVTVMMVDEVKQMWRRSIFAPVGLIASQCRISWMFLIIVWRIKGPFGPWK